MDDGTKRKGRIVIIALVVLGVAGGIGAAVGLQEEIRRFLNDDANYQKYKCNPFFMPFIHWSKHAGSPDESTAVKRDRNFKQCVAAVADPIIEEEKKPLVSLVSRITELNGRLASEANVFRVMAGYLRSSYLNVIKTTVDRVFGIKDAVANQFNVIQNLMRKQAALFSLFMEFTKSLRLMFMSFADGPIPKITEFMLKFWPAFIVFFTACVLCLMPFIGIIFCPICAICFTPESEIPTSRGPRAIADIRIGDMLKDHAIVIGKVQVMAGGTDLFAILPHGYTNPVECTGSHLVQSDGRWVRARNFSGARKSRSNYRGELVCLITSNNRIPVSDIVFRDYQEISEPYYVAEIKQRYINHLNKVERPLEVKDDALCHTYYWGFDGATLVNTKYGPTHIKDIGIGMDLVRPDGTRDRVIGRSVYSGTIPMWTIDGVRASGTTLVLEDGEWMEVRAARRAERSTFDIMIWNLITESGELHIGPTVWRDFMDSHDESFNDGIDDYLEDLANSLTDD